jgi:hypothetical protein
MWHLQYATFKTPSYLKFALFKKINPPYYTIITTFFCDKLFRSLVQIEKIRSIPAMQVCSSYDNFQQDIEKQHR